MVALNENEIVVGYPPFVSEGGIATGEVVAVSSEDRDLACRRGLRSALAKKKLHDGRGIILVVLAQDFYCQLLDCGSFSKLAEAVLAEQSFSFDTVCVLDEHDGFFVRVARRD